METNQTKQLTTGFENYPDLDLAREWEQIMSTSTFDGICSSVRFMRICQELDKRKLTPFLIGRLIAESNG